MSDSPADAPKPSVPFETHVRVRYEETDRMGVVYHTNYLVYFEVGRTELLRSLGHPYIELEEEGFVLAVVDCAARFVQSAQYDDLLSVRPYIKEVRKTRVTIGYEILVGEKLLVTGHTTHAVLERSTMRPARPPQSLMEALKKAQAQVSS